MGEHSNYFQVAEEFTAIQYADNWLNWGILGTVIFFKVQYLYNHIPYLYDDVFVHFAITFCYLEFSK